MWTISTLVEPVDFIASLKDLRDDRWALYGQWVDEDAWACRWAGRVTAAIKGPACKHYFA